MSLLLGRRVILPLVISVSVGLALSGVPKAWGQTADLWTVEHFGLAQQAQQENKLDLAARQYRLVISRNPRFAGAYLNLAIVYHQQMKYSEAVKALRTAVSLDPRLLGAQLFLGIDEYLTEDFKDALEHLKKALQLSPTDRQAGIYLGLTYLALNQPLKAGRVLRTTAEYYPEDADISYQLGEAYLEAMKQGLAQLKKTGSESAFYHWALAIAAKQKNDRVAVIEEYMRALARDPNVAELYWKLAVILRQSGFPELATAALQRYERLNPDRHFAQAVLDKAVDESPVNEAVLSENKEAFLRLWKAIPPMRPAYSMPPGVADGFVNRALKERLASPEGDAVRVALRLYSQGDYKGAAAKIVGLKLHATDWATAYLLASAYKQASEYEAAERVVEERLLPYLNLPSVSLLAVEIESQMAVRYLNRVAAMRPNSYLAKMLLAKSYAAAGQDKQALAAYQGALKLAPNQLGIHLAIGEVYEDELHWAPAIEEYRAELALDPANAMALAHLGHALTEAREASKAAPVLEKLLKANPTDGQAYADLGKARELEGQSEKAIGAYQRALRCDPNQISVHYRLFQLYRKVGEKDRAQKELTVFKAAEAQKHRNYQQAIAALK